MPCHSFLDTMGGKYFDIRILSKVRLGQNPSRSARRPEMNTRAFVRSALGAGEVLSPPGLATAQTYPSRPVRMIMIVAAGAIALAGLTAPAAAQAPSLASKNVQMIIGAGTGGPFDLIGRLVTRHIGKHLPGNPTVVPQNMPGAGSFTAANYIYNVAPKDGTVMGIIAIGAVLGPITGATGARYDATKMTWLGTPATITSFCIAYNSPQVKVKTLNDLYEKELVVGSTGTAAAGYFL